MFQGQGQVVNPVVQLSRIDCGIVIPSQWGLEQFTEMAKALKHIEDKHSQEKNYRSQQIPQEKHDDPSETLCSNPPLV